MYCTLLGGPSCTHEIRTFSLVHIYKPCKLRKWESSKCSMVTSVRVPSFETVEYLVFYFTVVEKSYDF